MSALDAQHYSKLAILSITCNCLSKVCCVHVVLSTLYQEKMVTEQKVKDLKYSSAWPWIHLVEIQCTNPPNVVKRTAKLLEEVGHTEEQNLLEGQ